jgi:hypothetical protein
VLPTLRKLEVWQAVDGRHASQGEEAVDADEATDAQTRLQFLAKLRRRGFAQPSTTIIFF